VPAAARPVNETPAALAAKFNVGDSGYADLMSSSPPTSPPPQPDLETPGVAESRRERRRRHSQRARLYAWSITLIVALVVIVALVLSNTGQVRVNWVFGHSHTSLVWLVLAAAIFGWFGGIATAIVLRRRTRASR
jgi:uncharacterized integral membrane protein